MNYNFCLLSLKYKLKGHFKGGLSSFSGLVASMLWIKKDGIACSNILLDWRIKEGNLHKLPLSSSLLWWVFCFVCSFLYAVDYPCNAPHIYVFLFACWEWLRTAQVFYGDEILDFGCIYVDIFYTILTILRTKIFFWISSLLFFVIFEQHIIYKHLSKKISFL